MNQIMKNAMKLALLVLCVGSVAKAALEGTYLAVLEHEGTNFYQVGEITLRTVNPGGTGQLKVSANVRIFFGDLNSNEFLSYEYPNVERNPVTGQTTIREAGRDVTLIGVLKTGTETISGNWYSTLLGKVGKFTAIKEKLPETPEGMQLVGLVSADYRGTLTNTHPDINLPERASITLVSRQDTENPEKGILISGSTRLYYGEFDSFEYEHIEFEDVQFNFYSRFLSARTKELGLVYKGTLALDGTFTGDVFADGYGKVGKVVLKARVL